MNIGGMVTSYQKNLAFISIYRYGEKKPLHIDTFVFGKETSTPLISPFVRLDHHLFILVSHQKELSTIEVLKGSQKIVYLNTMVDSVDSKTI